MVRPPRIPPKESSLLLDEYFSTADPRWLTELLESPIEKKGLSIATKWLKDKRPAMREMLIKYIDDGCDRPGHRLLVKKLFKGCEETKDTECMGHFMVALDRMVRRKITRAELRRGKSVSVRYSLEYENSMPASLTAAKRAGRFSRRTRLYLERRVFRYFRTLARTNVPAYMTAIERCLGLYSDEHMQKPEHLLCAWGLVHILFWGNKTITRGWKGLNLAPGATLGTLVPAPFAPDGWKQLSIDAYLNIIENAQNALVRSSVFQILCTMKEAELQQLSMAHVRRLLRSRTDELQSLGAELLRSRPELALLPVSEWLELLQSVGPSSQGIIAELAVEHVNPARLTLGQCIELACSSAAPVANVGLEWAQGRFDRATHTTHDLAMLTHLANASVESVRGQGIQWIVELMNTSPHAQALHVRDLIDARYEDVRTRGLTLATNEARFRTETLLWAAMSESPHAHVRDHLIAHLAQWTRADATRVQHVWATVLLAVHRGSKVKGAVIRQVIEAIQREEANTTALLGLMAYVLRSVRKPERRTGLAAIAQLAFRRPALRALIEQTIPEIRLFEGEAA